MTSIDTADTHVGTGTGAASGAESDSGIGPDSVMLSLDGIARTFADGTGLTPVILDIARGEFITVLGPSGCGKSTLLRCVAGLETPTSGVMNLGGRKVFDAGDGAGKAVNVPPAKRRLSMVFQDLALWPHMSVAGNVEFALTARGGRIPAAERKRRVGEALEMVGISAKSDQRPHQLSGGQQQRVAIARAVVSRPDLLLMDEPLSALDAALRVQVRREITDLTRELGLTVLYVTHDQDEALSMADRVLVLREGEVAQFDRPAVVYDRPADEFVADFVGTMNRNDAGLAVRPEQVEVAAAGANDVADVENGTTATVESCSYVGGRYEIRCAVSGAPKPWLVHSVGEHAPGTKLRLRYPAP